MFCRLESLVRGILQIPFYRFERNLDRKVWFIHVFCKKKQAFEATENKSRLSLNNNLVLKNSVESVRSNL